MHLNELTRQSAHLHSNDFGRHPEYTSGRLLELVIAAPSTLDGGETEIADLDRVVVLMEEDVVRL